MHPSRPVPVPVPRVALSLCLLLAAPACGHTTTTAAAADSAADAAAAAQQGTDAAHDAAGGDGTVLGQSAAQAFFAAASPLQLAGTALLRGCTGQVTGSVAAIVDGTAVDANTVFDPNACTGATKVEGSASATMTVSGAVGAEIRHLSVVESLVMTLASGATIAVSTLDPSVTAATYSAVAAGDPAAGATTQTLTLNERRVRADAAGRVAYNHAITTPDAAPLQVRSTYVNGVETGRTLVSGSLQVVHALTHTTSKITVDHLTYSETGGGCTCPTGGTLTQEVTGETATYTRTSTFSGCGSATVTTTGSNVAAVANGTVAAHWADCGA